MPWFLVDDKSHSHPKFLAASNAAIGLWVKCGAWIAEHLTDGNVPGGLVKQMRGTKAQVDSLVNAGLWHAAGHDCPRCPQPAEGDFHMHDYATEGHGNKQRTDVERAREYEREKKAKQRAGQPRGPQPPQPPQGPGLFDDEPPPPPPRGGQPRSPETGPIPDGWRPSEDDVAAAQIARADAGRSQLTPAQLDAMTEKFTRRMREDGKTAAGWGSRWREWAIRERPEAGVVVHGEFGQPQTRGQQQRAGLARLRQERQGGAG